MLFLAAHDLASWSSGKRVILWNQRTRVVVVVVFVALRPMSTAMVIAGRSVHLTTLFPGQALASG